MHDVTGTTGRKCLLDKCISNLDKKKSCKKMLKEDLKNIN